MAEAEHTRAHVLIFPYPAHGHMIPLLDLAHALASLGLRITILTTPGNRQYIEPLLQSASANNFQIRPLIFPLPPTDGLPPGTENFTTLSGAQVPVFNYALHLHLSPRIIAWYNETSTANDRFGRPVCMITDFFLGWTQKTAQELGIPRMVFYPSGALAIVALHLQWEHVAHISVLSEDDPVPLKGLPVNATFRKFQLSLLTRMYVKGDPLCEFTRETFLLNVKSWGTVINSFYGFEGLFISHLEKISGRPVWPVGPLLPLAAFGKESVESVVGRGKESSVKDTGLLKFLDSKKERSVVYVCFGSRVVLTAEQVDALACGLEECGADFIWVMSEEKRSLNGSEGGVLRDGFKERVGDRGIVIKGWAPQLMVLRHPSVGCFVSHCGWNSVLESVACGVPLVTWPFTADQHFDDWLVVEHLHVGVRLCLGMDAVPDKKRFIECVDTLLGKGGACDERRRMMDLSVMASTGVEKGGASRQSLADLADTLGKLPLHA